MVASPSLDQIDTTSKYKDLDPLQAGGGKSASANRVTVRKVSREMAKEIYPNDGKKQQEYINFIHDHQSHPLGKNPGDVFSSEEKVVGFNPLAIEEHTIEVSIEEFEDLSTFISTIINQLKNVASTIQLTYSRTNSTTESENFGNFIQEILGTTPMIPNLRIVRGCPYATISIKQTSDKIFIEFGRNRWIFFSRGFVRDNRKTSENLGEVFAVNTQSVTSPFSVLINWFSGFQLPFDIIDKLKIFGSVTNSPTISPVHNTPIRHEQPQDVSGISRNNFEIPFVKCMLSIVQNDVGVAMSTPTFIMESTESSPIIFPSTDNTSLGCSNSRQIYPSIIRLTELEYKGIVPSDMWTLNTKPYKDAHFATFSPEVCEIPIKASCPREVCKKCGKPKIHKVETKIADMEDLPKEQQEAIRRAGSLDGFYEGEATKDYKEANAQNPSDAKRSILESMRRVVVSDSWVATCNCNEGFKEGVVLDIFAGSGTTASVAKSLNRSSISIEINPEYIPLIKKRLDFNQTTLDNIIRYYEKID